MKINDNIEITNEDNMLLMARYPDNYFDLAVVDPPYGINAEQGTNRASKKQFARKKAGWDSKPPTQKYYTELMRVSKNQIIWGANHFIEDIPKANSKSWIIWDKKNPDRCFADGEMAWCSQLDNVRIINLKRVQELNKSDGGKIHPTQKPIQLYEWIFKKYTKKDFKIIDTHLGSGTIVKALDKVNKHDKMNLSIVGCEIDKEYFDDSIKSIMFEVNQKILF